MYGGNAAARVPYFVSSAISMTTRTASEQRGCTWPRIIALLTRNCRERNATLVILPPRDGQDYTIESPFHFRIFLYSSISWARCPRLRLFVEFQRIFFKMLAPSRYLVLACNIELSLTVLWVADSPRIQDPLKTSESNRAFSLPLHAEWKNDDGRSKREDTEGGREDGDKKLSQCIRARKHDGKMAKESYGYRWSLSSWSSMTPQAIPYLRNTPPRRLAFRHSGGDSRLCTSATVTLYLLVLLSNDNRPGTEQNTSDGCAFPLNMAFSLLSEGFISGR